MGLTKILISSLKLNVPLNVYLFILFTVISFGICYYIVFRNNIYLEYFKEYENWTKNETKSYVWISFGFIIGVIALFFASLLIF